MSDFSAISEALIISAGLMVGLSLLGESIAKGLVQAATIRAAVSAPPAQPTAPLVSTQEPPST